MKKLLTISILILLTGNLPAQTWAEWFRQKQTQKKYLLQQIAALQVYTGYLSKGYSIAKDGLNTIQNIKHGDFSLHNNYFTSLVTVNPKIKQSPRVADIIAIQASIVQQTVRSMRRFASSPQFTNPELEYLKYVFNDLLRDCAKNLDYLNNLITNGNLQMKDDERIKAIERIHTDMEDKQVFVRAFINSANGLSVQRINDANDIIISKKLNGLK